MSSTNKTANFKLSQFIGTDKPTFLGDYNNDMEIIDGALFTASQTAEEAVNDVEKVKGAQEELKAVHEDTKKQVAQLKETADGMTGDVTAAQEAANSAEEKATAAQTAATDVLNAANATSANATKAKQTADGNKVTIQDLTRRVESLETTPKTTPIKIYISASTDENGINGTGGVILDNPTYSTIRLINQKNMKDNSSIVVTERNELESGAMNTLITLNKNQLPSSDVDIKNKKYVFITLNTGSQHSFVNMTCEFELK